MKQRKIFMIIGSIVLAVLLFGGGLFAGLSVGGAKTKWFQEMISRNYYEEVDDEKIYTVIGQYVLDPYSAYYNPEAYAELTASRAGSMTGYGFTYRSQGEALLYSIVGNSPAEHAGMRAGMIVQALSPDGINFIPVTGETIGKTIDSFGEGATVTFQTDHGNFTCTRQTYVQSYVYYRSSLGAYRFWGDKALTPTHMDESLPLPADTAYIRLTGFYGDAAKQMELALNCMKEEGKTNLVLDLRENGGGLLSVCEEITSYFMKDATGNKPLIMTAKYKNGRVEKSYASKNVYAQYFSESSKIYVLADSGTASASECLIGAMVDYGTVSFDRIYLSERNGVARSYGKGIMQNTYPYIDGSALKLTVATVHWPISDRCIHAVGVTPNDGAIPVPVTGVDEPDLITILEKIPLTF